MGKPSAGRGGSTSDAAADSGNESAPTAKSGQVWLGELWSISPGIFCDLAHDREPWVTDTMGFTWRVLLRLDLPDQGEMGGSIQFGEGPGPLPKPPELSPRITQADLGTFWTCTIHMPVAGVSYRIVSGSLTNQRLDFEIAPNEIWDDWCESERPACPEDRASLCGAYPTCVCEDGACRADRRVHFAVRLTRTADTLEGQLALPTGHGGTPVDVRLRRVK
jgi:hypothetical protein